MGSFDGVPGELRGVFFKSVMGSMLLAKTLFPRLVEQVETMHDEGWYPWRAYLEALEMLSSQLDDSVMKRAGRRVITNSRSMFMLQGFTSLQKVMSAYASMFDANVRGVPEDHRVGTVSYRSGRVEMTYGAQQPVAISEGYLRGFFEIFDTRIDELTITRLSPARVGIIVTWTP
ncbi:MAG: hypothetical protein AAF799_34765 [Myxococcota bacterium]